MISRPRSRFLRRLGWMTAVFILPLAFAWPLLSQSLWIDEASSVWFAQLQVRDLLTALCDPHPPGYYLLLKLWLQAGQQEFWLRVLSLLAASLAAAIVYRLGRNFWRDGSGWLAALLLAWVPLQIWYATEARMYLLVQLLGLLAFWLGWELWAASMSKRKQRILSVLYWLTASFALWLDYSALLPLFLLQLLWLAKGRPQAKRWQVLQAAVFLPTFIAFLLSKQTIALEQTYQPVFIAVQAARLGLTIRPDDAARLLQLVVVGIIIISLATAWYWPRWRSRPSMENQKLGYVFAGCWLAMLLLMAVPYLFTVKRLLVVMLPYLALLTAYGLNSLNRWARYGILSLGLVITIAILPQQEREPWRQVTADLQETFSSQAGVVWVDEMVVPAFDFYVTDMKVDRWTSLFGRRLPELPALVPETGETLWLVTSRSPYRNLVRLLPADFFAEFEGELVREEEGIRVFAYRHRLETELTVFDPVQPPTREEQWGLLLPSPLDTCAR